MTIYVLTRGEYSDYGIEALFSTREKAEAVAAEYGDANPVFAMEVDALQPSADGRKVYQVSMDKDDNSDSPYLLNPDGVVHNEPWGPLRRDNWATSSVYSFRVRAEDPEHAIKIANEKRLQMIANGKWEDIEE